MSENAPKKLTPQEVGASKGVKFVNAACGRSHTVLVGSDGQVWTSGVNNSGQVFMSETPKLPAVETNSLL